MSAVAGAAFRWEEASGSQNRHSVNLETPLMFPIVGSFPDPAQLSVCVSVSLRCLSGRIRAFPLIREASNISYRPICVVSALAAGGKTGEGEATHAENSRQNQCWRVLVSAFYSSLEK